MRCLFLLAVLIGGTFAPPLQAQVPFIDKLFGSITDVNAYTIFGSLEGDLDGLTAGPVGSDDRDGLRGFGIEVSFDVGGIGRAPHSPPRLPPVSKECRTLAFSKELGSPEATVRDTALAELRKACVAPAKVDTAYHPKTRQTAVNPQSGGVTVTTLDSIKITDEEEKEDDPLLNVEVALGFAQISAFRSQSSSPEFRGSMQEFPSLAAYISYDPAEVVSFYGGPRVGLVKLDGLRAFELDTTMTPGETADSALRSRIYTGTGTTYLLGGSAGLLLKLGPLTMFVERAYTRRRFGTVEWAHGSNEIIRTLPRSLKLDTWSWNIGAQATIKSN
jgi:hypothetical protein